MTSLPPLQLIAREKNWMDFAILLEEAMQRYDSYGLADPNAVRAAIGRMRRQLPSSLTSAVKAMQYLRERHPDVLGSRDAGIGCANVRLLARLAEVSPSAAAEAAPGVFAGDIRQVDLRAKLHALQHEAKDGERRIMRDGPRTMGPPLGAVPAPGSGDPRRPSVAA